jgi:ribokinase
MTQPDLVVIGEAALDVLVDCPRPVAWGQAETVVPDARLVLGSSGAITAAAAARLGVATAFVGVVGDDHAGDIFVADLGATGVDVSGVRRVAGARTGMTVVLQDRGERALLTFPGTMADLVAGAVGRAYLDARHVHVSSYFLQTGLHAGLGALLAAASAHGATTSIDPGWDPGGTWDHGLLGLLGHVDWLLPNGTEAAHIAAAAGAPPAVADDAEARLDVLAPGGRGAAVKLGAAGAVLRHAGRTVRLGTDAVEPVDTTGAGDNFDAGFIAGLLSGADPADALVAAMACGRIALGGRGGTGQMATRDAALAAGARWGPRRPAAPDTGTGTGTGTGDAVTRCATDGRPSDAPNPQGDPP